MTRAAKSRSIVVKTLGSEPLSLPPTTVTGLRALLLKVARGESDVSLGPKARQALAQILDLQGDSALFSITALAEKLDVNPSTLTRLARNLGYSGFRAFQEVLLSASMTPPGSFYTRQAHMALTGDDASSPGGIARLCRENQANIDRFLESCDMVQFKRATELITSAGRVSVHGIRQFHALASFLVYGLGMIRSDVQLLDANALGVAEGIAAMQAGDVLIAASCAPYSAQVVESARAAAECGLSVIALTDRANAPLVEVSNVAILVPHETSFLSNSLTTFILAAECLINGCAAADPTQAKSALAERDRMIKRLGIEI